MSRIANSVYQQVLTAEAELSAQWAVNGKQTRPWARQAGLGISWNTNVKPCSFLTSADTPSPRHSQSLARPVLGKVLLSCVKVIQCKLPVEKKIFEHKTFTLF